MIVRAVRLGIAYATIAIQEAYHFYVASTNLLAAIEEILEAVDIAWESNLQIEATTQQLYYGWAVTRVDIPQQNTYYFGYLGLTDGVGDNATTPLPAQVTLPLNFYAESPYPRRARKLLGVFTESSNTTGGLPDTDLKNRALDFGGDLLAIEEADGEAAYMVSVKYTGDPPYVSDYNQVKDVSVAARWGTLRSRRT